jgi:hypothetical protein
MEPRTKQNDEHPVKQYLLSHVTDAKRREGNTRVEEAVLNHGRPFKGIKRPKGFLLGKKGRCFANAGYLAYNLLGLYVEGFASPPGQPPVHHAWVTLDGVHAIDVTFRKPATDCLYFGIPIPLNVLQKWIERPNGYLTMFDGIKPIEQIDETLKDASREPLNFFSMA